MGRNGSGKSTLAYALMGHPKYVVDRGEINFKGENVTGLSADRRARRGMFLAFQYPMAIPGVSVANFLRTAVNAALGDGDGKKSIPVSRFRKELKRNMDRLKIEPSFAKRYHNEGFSGGEKKRMEVLQMAMLKPVLAILDEADSGLDIDALKTVSEGVNGIMDQNMGALVITHYQRILNYIKPHFVHVMADGRIVASGGPELAHKLEAEGYEWLEREGVPADGG
jgi:Fe-S cluster assembly ATP-binding protein